MDVRRDWSDREVVLAVEDYFDMLLAEVEGRLFNKAEHRRSLLQKHGGRTNASIERKHQNISAVLISQNISPIDGYKPLPNYQHLLATRVVDYLDRHPELVDRLTSINNELPTPAGPATSHRIHSWSIHRMLYGFPHRPEWLACRMR